MKKLFTILMLVFALTLTGCSTGSKEIKSPEDVSMATIDEYLGREGAKYVDLRNVSDKYVSGYIDGFEVVSFFEYLDGKALVRNNKWDYSSADLKDKAILENLFGAKDREIFLMCAGGTRAGYVKAALEEIGYTKVYNVGGLGDYAGENKVLGDPVWKLVEFNNKAYKGGTYFAFLDNGYQATLVVDKSGKITGLFFDAATLKTVGEEKVATTKQQLGKDYGFGMWKISWADQVNMFASKVIETQGMDWYAFYETQKELDTEFGTKENGDSNKLREKNGKMQEYVKQDIDGVAGVTIHVEALAELTYKLLEMAKK